ncbi:TPA: oligosaccharide repeat unit polymerase [Acinetobacter baumannii]|nr:oligosaccharide repeat unit polymerase [Acinetobacter baumannii]
MRKLILNPFFYYILTFAIAFLLYQLGWSDLYPDLSGNILNFVVITLILSVPCLLIFSNICSRCFKNLSNHKLILNVSKRNIYGICIFMIFMMLIEFVYNKGVPLFFIVKGVEYKYTLFGIPVLHVFILPFIAVLGFTFFYRYIIFGEKKYLLPVFLSFLFPILIFNRAIAIFMLLGCLFIYLFYTYSFSKIIKGVLILVVALYIFGLAGNMRMKSSGFVEDNAVLNIGKASYKFENSIVPNEFFWGYLYLSSPLANMQNEINTFNPQNDGFVSFVVYEVFPDFISKRINPMISGVDQANLIDENLNVSTMYGGAIHKLNILGAYLLYFYYILFVFFFTIFCSGHMRAVMLTVLSTISVLLIFTNLLTSSGFFFQVLFILLFSRLRVKGFSII